MSLTGSDIVKAGEPTADDPGGGRPGLRRFIVPLDGVGVVLAVTIGAGIFVVPQEVARSLASFPQIALAWALVGGLAILGGLVSIELATRLPRTGGNYVYLRQAFGRHVAFLYGWRSFALSAPSMRAGLALVAASYVGQLIALDGDGRFGVAAAAVLLLGAVNYVGIDWSVRYQRLSAVVKVAALLGLIAAGVTAALHDPGRLLARAEPVGDDGHLKGLASAMILIFFAYTGWARLPYVAGEIRDPRRTVPRAILGGLTATVLLYVALNAVYCAVLGVEGVRESGAVAADTAVRLIGPAGSGLFAGLVIVSVTGSMCTSTMAAARVYYAMARDGLFFRCLDFVHPRFRTPSRAVVAHTAMSIVMLSLKRSFAELLTTAVFVNLAFYLLWGMTLFRLRRDGIGSETAFRVPFYPWLPAIYIGGLAALFLSRLVFDWRGAWVDLSVVAAGYPLSIAWTRWRRRSVQAAPEAA